MSNSLTLIALSKIITDRGNVSQWLNSRDVLACKSGAGRIV